MKSSMTSDSNLARRTQQAWSRFAVLALLMTVSMSAFAQGGAASADGAVCKFFGNINGLLNIASIAVVTIAIIFSGYQIAFAHKRISDVAPVLIGAVLIGGAAQFAKMILPDMTDSCSTAAGMIMLNAFGM